MDENRIRRSGKGSLYLPLLAVLLVTTTVACLPVGPERERVARENAQIRQDPLFAPPPDATKLGGFDNEPSMVNTSAGVTVIYASPHPMGEVAAWYEDRFGEDYDLRFPSSPNGLGEISTVGGPVDNPGLNASVSLQPDPPPAPAPSRPQYKQAPPGTRTYIWVGVGGSP